MTQDTPDPPETDSHSADDEPPTDGRDEHSHGDPEQVEHGNDPGQGHGNDHDDDPGHENEHEHGLDDDPGHEHDHGHDRADGQPSANADAAVSTEQVEAALRQVRDPETETTVLDAGVVEDVRVSGASVTIVADLREFPREAASQVSQTMVHAVSDVDGVQGAHVEQADPSPDLEGRSVGIQKADRVIAVASAKGGVGKTTVATSLACALAASDDDTEPGDSPGGTDASDSTRGVDSSDSPSVGLFDADIYGPNVPAVLETAGPVYSDDDGNPVPIDVGGLEVMSIGLLSEGAPLAWRGAMAHDALSDLFEETAWSDPDTVVVDLPPGTGDVVLTTLQDVPIDAVVLVTTPFHAAVSDTGRALQLFEENDVPVLGVVSNMGEFVCENCGTAHDLFGGDDPIDALEVPVLAELPFTPDMQDTPAPTPADLPEHAHALATAVDARYDDVWTVDVPDDAVDLRGLDADARTDRVSERFENLAAGDELFVVSDRDPTPVKDYLLELVDADELPSFKVKRQNPETWLARATHP